MCSSPRDTLPLPAEITRCILFMVSEPTTTHDERKRTWKYAEQRNLGHPPTDIQNARLVCKSFADLGAEFLFRTLVVCADHSQLAHVKEIAEHKRLCKAVRTLDYDCNVYLRNWYGEHDSPDTLVCRPKSMHRRLLYEEQEEIFRRDLDTECLRSALTALTAMTTVRCRPHSSYRYRTIPTARRETFPDAHYAQPDTRPLYRLAAAMAAVPTHRIRTLDLIFPITLLADVVSAPARFEGLRAAFATITNLNLAITTAGFDDFHNDHPDHPRHPDLSSPDAVAQFATKHFGLRNDGSITTPPALYKALLAHRTTHNGPLSMLLDATPHSLHRLKLSLAPDGRRRSHSHTWRFGVPFSCYVGTAGDVMAPAAPGAYVPPTRWPALRYLSLACIDMRQDELLPFLLARRKSLAYVEFDRVALTQGQWTVVGAAVEYAFPKWGWSKRNNLTQVEEERERVALPDEVVRAIEEEEGVVRDTVTKGECYFQAGEECSTWWGMGEAEKTGAPGYGRPV